MLIPEANITSMSAAVSYRRFAQNPASEEATHMPSYVGAYHTNTHEVCEFFAALEARAMAAASESLVALNSYLTEETLELARFSAQQSRAQAALQSIHSRVTAKIDRFNAKKKASAVFFTLAAAASTFWAAVTAGLDHKRQAALAAVASILSAAVGKWINSEMKKSERGMKKEREIVRCMIVGGGFSIRNLAEIYALAQDMKSEAEAMVDDGRERAAGLKLKLKERFHELQRKANQGGLDACSSREMVLVSFLRNLD